VRRLRERLGLTQEQSARLLGVTWTTVSRWERSQARPDARSLAKLERLAELVDLIGDAIRPEDVARFLTTPHPELRGHPPIELIENAFGVEAVKSLVLAAQSGAYR
jgi:transcriptional regulator with XRE-family HTH domain